MSQAARLDLERAALRRRVRQSLAMAGRTLEAVLHGTADGDAHEPGAPPLQRGKVIAEVALLLRGSAGLGDATLDALVDGLARRLAPHARDDAVLAALCREPSRAAEHATAHLLLGDIGHADPAFDTLLARVLAQPALGSPERLASHELELHWLAGLCRAHAPAGPPGGDARLARRLLDRPLDALGATAADLYVFTHVVLHASDMGRRMVVLPQPPAAIAAQADAALAAALDADHHDLAAELLWTWPMLGLRWTPAARFAFELLCAVHDAHGFLPGPGHQPPRASTEPGHVLRSSYHATIVMGLLCGAVLRSHGPGPGDGWDTASADPRSAGAAVDRLLARLDAQAHRPRWRAVFATLPAARQATLAGWLLALALRRAARAADLPALRDLLGLAADAGLLDGPAVYQALALLQRALLLDRRGVRHPQRAEAAEARAATA